MQRFVTHNKKKQTQVNKGVRIVRTRPELEQVSLHVYDLHTAPVVSMPRSLQG